MMVIIHKQMGNLRSENMEKEPNAILELKITVPKIKNSLDGPWLVWLSGLSTSL